MGLKKYQQLIIISLYIHISGCYPENNQSTTNPPVKYMAHLNGDTAIATLKQSPSIFNGILEIHYKGNYKDSGDVRGVIQGDTLFGDYHFKHYGLPKWYREPITFLKQGDTLIMGKGITMFTMGVPHVNKSYPIDYNKSRRFVFTRKKE